MRGVKDHRSRYVSGLVADSPTQAPTGLHETCGGGRAAQHLGRKKSAGSGT